MSLLVDFSNDTYFPQTPIADVPNGFVIGYDPDEPAKYFKMATSELKPSFGGVGFGTAIIGGTAPEFTQKLITTSEAKGQNSSKVIEIDATTSLNLKFDQDQIDGDTLKITNFEPNNYVAANDTLQAHFEGINAKLGSQAEQYDAGWSALRTRDSSVTAGVLAYVPGEASAYYEAPKVRVINRELHFTGTIYIPNAASEGGGPILNLETAHASQTNYVATGGGSGWSLVFPTAGGNNAEVVLSNIFRTSNNRFLPAAKHQLGTIRFRRKVVIRDQTGLTTADYGYLYADLDAYIDTTGNIRISNPRSVLSDQENYYHTGAEFSNVVSNQQVLTAANPDSTTGATLDDAYSDSGSRLLSTRRWPVTFQGLVTQLGGFYANVSFSFTLAPSLTMTQISSEFSELLAG